LPIFDNQPNRYGHGLSKLEQIIDALKVKHFSFDLHYH